MRDFYIYFSHSLLKGYVLVSNMLNIERGIGFYFCHLDGRLIGACYSHQPGEDSCCSLLNFALSWRNTTPILDKFFEKRTRAKGRERQREKKKRNVIIEAFEMLHGDRNLLLGRKKGFLILRGLSL